jgi:hypothetical protein
MSTIRCRPAWRFAMMMASFSLRAASRNSSATVQRFPRCLNAVTMGTEALPVRSIPKEAGDATMRRDVVEHRTRPWMGDGKPGRSFATTC